MDRVQLVCEPDPEADALAFLCQPAHSTPTSKHAAAPAASPPGTAGLDADGGLSGLFLTPMPSRTAGTTNTSPQRTGHPSMLSLKSLKLRRSAAKASAVANGAGDGPLIRTSGGSGSSAPPVASPVTATASPIPLPVMHAPQPEQMSAQTPAQRPDNSAREIAPPTVFQPAAVVPGTSPARLPAHAIAPSVASEAVVVIDSVIINSPIGGRVLQ